MNSPYASKINYTQLLALGVGIAATLNYIPAELEEQLVEVTLIVLPAVTVMFRSLFTGNK